MIRAFAKIEHQKVKEVSFKNVPAFVYQKDVELEIPDLERKIKLDISFGGSFFAIVSARELELKVEPCSAQRLIRAGISIRSAINNAITVRHPVLEHIKTVDLVEIYDDPTHPQANYKNAVIFGQGQIDRSPCGTGTCAKLAALHARGQIKEGETFIYESIMGTLFYGRILEKTKVGNLDAIIPEITGSAFITGFHNFVFDEDDPVKYGFVLA